MRQPAVFDSWTIWGFSLTRWRCRHQLFCWHSKFLIRLLQEFFPILNLMIHQLADVVEAEVVEVAEAGGEGEVGRWPRRKLLSPLLTLASMRRDTRRTGRRRQ